MDGAGDGRGIETGLGCAFGAAGTCLETGCDGASDGEALISGFDSFANSSLAQSAASLPYVALIVHTAFCWALAVLLAKKATTAETSFNQCGDRLGDGKVSFVIVWTPKV
jgi:hypothetical protein